MQRAIRLALASFVLSGPACKGVDHTATAASSALAPANSSVVVDGDILQLPALGFSIQKPSNWVFAPTGWHDENFDRLKLKDEELQAQVQKSASEPFVVIMKYPETVDTLNPVFKANLRPLGPLREMTAEAIARMVLPQMQEVFENFELIEDVEPTQISGHRGAHFKASFTVEDISGRVMPVLADQWIVKRGAFMFMLGASGPPEGPDASHDDFDKILHSVVIEPAATSP